jgi:hypothetical protein
MMNMNIEVTELLAKTLENMVKNAVRASIENVSNRHGLDLEAELKAVGLDTAKLVRKAMPKSSKVKAVKEVKVKVKVAKSSFPLPFSAEHVNPECCQGISYNRGLFTQCPKSQMDSGSFCKSCQSEADGSASGKPSCGTVGERLACGLYEYTDAKGRKPLPYLLVLEKLKLSLPEEIEIDEEHLTAKKVSKSKKSERGRPKKAALSVTVDEPADLFSQLQPEEEEEVEQEQVVEEKPSKSKKLNDSEKAEKKAALEAEKAEKLAAKKAALEAEREAKKAALEAEREAKKAALEAEKATKKAALEAEKATKKAALEAEKEAKKAAQKPKAAEKPKAAQKKAEKAEEQEQVQEKEQEQSPATSPAKVSASRVKIDGVEYLKTGANILYNPATKEPVGLWNPATKEIEELPEDSDEEEEEDYESEEEN